MFGGVKIALITSLTILTSCVLFISYNECTNRYIIHGNSDNTIWIFDKKSTTLNKCGEDGCKVVETKFPKDSPLALTQSFSPSKMFGSDKSMQENAKATAEATNANADAGKEATSQKEEKKDDKPKDAQSASKPAATPPATTTTEKKEEFVE
ncbi:MAG: hypothetical protein LBR78_01315 [Holosporales bacterium]|jgi:hypothetical protein|nr:hypothetical protein [Holosporales bacterium]